MSGRSEQHKCAVTCDFQQFGSLTCVDSDEPVQQLQMMFSQ